MLFSISTRKINRRTATQLTIDASVYFNITFQQSCNHGKLSMKLQNHPRTCNTQEDCKDIAICLQKQCVPAKPAGGFCTNNDDCNTGQTCVFGLCMVPAVDLNSECKTSHDCKKQTICVNGKCKVAATIGKQCKVDSDCDDGQSCRFGVCWFLYLPPVN